jgi:hypothetical protein
MQQVQKSSIRVGHKYVAEVWVDSGAVKGEGGPNRPELVVPVSIQMAVQPDDAQLGVAWLRGSLSLSVNPISDKNLSRPVDEVTVGNRLIVSLATSGRDQEVILRFPIAADEIERMEGARHSVGADGFTLYLSLQTVVVAVASVINDHAHRSGRWDANLGMLAELLPFWHSIVDPVRFTVSQSHWVNQVLPGLGYEQRRLIEVAFPPSLPEHGRAAREWDKARTALDTGHYDECIALCRSQLRGWSKQLGASGKQPVAMVIAAKRGWAADDSGVPFIDSIWSAALNMTNSQNHPEGSADDPGNNAADARMMLLLTAALSEYVHQQIQPPKG